MAEKTLEEQKKRKHSSGFGDIINSTQWTVPDGKFNALAPLQALFNSFGKGRERLDTQVDNRLRTEATVPKIAEGAVTQQNAETGRINANTGLTTANTGLATASSGLVNSQKTGVDLANQNLEQVVKKTRADAADGDRIARELEAWYGSGVTTQIQGDIREAGRNRVDFETKFGYKPNMFNMVNTGNTAKRAQTKEEQIAAQNTALFTQGEPLSPEAQFFRTDETAKSQLKNTLNSQKAVHAADNKSRAAANWIQAYNSPYATSEDKQMMIKLAKQFGVDVGVGKLPTGDGDGTVDPYKDVDGKTGSENKKGASANLPVNPNTPSTTAASPAWADTHEGVLPTIWKNYPPKLVADWLGNQGVNPSSIANNVGTVAGNIGKVFSRPTGTEFDSVPGFQPKAQPAQTPKAETKKSNAEQVMMMLEKFKVQTPDATPLVDLKSLEALLDASKDAPETLRNRVNVGRGELEADLEKVREMIRQLQNPKGAK